MTGLQLKLAMIIGLSVAFSLTAVAQPFPPGGPRGPMAAQEPAQNATRMGELAVTQGAPLPGTPGAPAAPEATATPAPAPAPEPVKVDNITVDDVRDKLIVTPDEMWRHTDKLRIYELLKEYNEKLQKSSGV